MQKHEKHDDYRDIFVYIMSLTHITGLNYF